MPSDRDHEVVASIASRAYHLTSSEVLALIEEDDELSSLSWAQRHAETCVSCRREIEAMRRALEDDQESPPSAAALLLDGRAYRLVQTESAPQLFEVAGLKVTVLIALKAKYAGDRSALGVVQTPERSFTFAFDELSDQRISIWDRETGEAPLRLAAATREMAGTRKPSHTLWPALRRDEEPICEFFGDFYDNAFVRLTTPVEEG